MAHSRRAFLAESAAVLGAATLPRLQLRASEAAGNLRRINISLTAFSAEVYDYLYWRLWDPYFLSLGIPVVNQSEGAASLDLLLLGNRPAREDEAGILNNVLILAEQPVENPDANRDSFHRSLAGALQQLGTARGVIAVQPAVLGSPLAAPLAARCGVAFVDWRNDTPEYSLATDHPLLIPLGQSVESTVSPHVTYEWHLGVLALASQDVVTRFANGEPDIVFHNRAALISSNLLAELYRFRRHPDYARYEASTTGTLISLMRAALGADPITIPFPKPYTEWRYHFYGYGFGRQFIVKLMNLKGASLSPEIRRDVLQRLDHSDEVIAAAAQLLLVGDIEGMQRIYLDAAQELVACRRTITKVEPYYVRGWHGGLLSDQVVEGMLIGHAEWGWPSNTMLWAEARMRASERLNFKQINQVNGATWHQVERHGLTDLDSWKKAGADGLIDSIKGMYSDAYLEVLGTESNLRQFEFGLQALRAMGGNMLTFMVAVDDFAFHPQIPQIIRGFGFEHAVLRSGGPGKIKGIDRELVLWKGLDGSSIPAVPTYASVPWPAFWLPDAGTNQMAKVLVAAEAAGFRTTLSGGAVDAGLMIYGELEYEALNTVAPVQATLTTVGDYCRAVASDPESFFLGVDDLQGEPWFWAGFGSINAICREDRRLDRLLVAAEKFSAIAMQNGRPYPSAPLEEAWRGLLSSQDHYAYGCGGPDNPGGYNVSGYLEPQVPNYPGPRTPITMEDTSQRWKAEATSAAQTALDGALAHLCDQEKRAASAGGNQIFVFNALNWERSGIVEAWVSVRGNTVHLEMTDGNSVTPAVITARRQGEVGEEVQICFHGQAPSLGFHMYTVREAAKGPDVDRGAATSLENKFLRVNIDPQTGAIASLVDKSSGKNVLRQGEHTRFACAEPLVDSDQAQAKITADRSDALLRRILVSGQFGACPYKMGLTLGHESPWLEIDLELDYGKGAIFGYKGIYGSLLRMIFPFSKGASRWVNQPFGVYPTQSDHPVMLDFCDVSDGSLGVAILHDGVPGLHVADDNVELLISDGFPPLRGVHQYRFALYPHAGTWREGQVLQRAHEFQQSLIAHPVEGGGIKLPLERSYLQVGPGVILSGLNVSNDGRVRARFYDATGSPQTVRTSWAFPLAKVWSARLDGKVADEIPASGNTIQFDLPAWKIFTLVGQFEREAKA